MRRVLGIGLLTVGLLFVTGAPVRAEMLSKKYHFKPDVVLEIGADAPGGLRLDSVLFRLPRRVKGKSSRTGGPTSARVAVSNTSDSSVRVGLAIALVDDAGRLLGVASGGTRLAAIKPGRQKQ